MSNKILSTKIKSDAKVSRRKFLQTSAATGVVMTSPVSFSANTVKTDTTNNSVTNDPLQKVLRECGSEFGHLKELD